MAGIYIHIPFCKQKCTYCDFHFSTTFHSYRSKMIASLIQEIELQKEYLKGKAIETIYFGGGTPSLLTIDELNQILSKIHSTFNTENLLEVTLEANPDDINTEVVQAWKSIGVNRLSIGLQSFKESDLKWMNRAHNVEESFTCVKSAIDGGIPNLTVDLMYGLPDLSNEEWRNHIQTVIDLGVQHVSAYCLTVEEGTLLDKEVEKGTIVPPGDDLQAEQFLILVDTLEQNGIMQYEISNFGRPGFESKHNSNYWKGTHYLGIGPSAHSFDGKSRSWNVANNQKYMQQIALAKDWNETEILSKNDVFNELILTGLRTIEGVNLAQLDAISPLDDKINKQIDQFCSENLMEQSNNSIRLTKIGRLQADRIASDMFRV